MNPADQLVTKYEYSMPTAYIGQHMHTPNGVFEWLKFLTCIREVPASNLGPETGYPDVRYFPQSLQVNAGIIP
jgi:hypothetical protein